MPYDREFTHNILEDPKPGFFLMRLVKKGPQVAARIIFEDGMWRAEINGEPSGKPVDSVSSPSRAKAIWWIWEAGERTTEEVYNHKLALKAWALEHQPEHPAANPDKPINLNELPPITWRV